MKPLESGTPHPHPESAPSPALDTTAAPGLGVPPAPSELVGELPPPPPPNLAEPVHGPLDLNPDPTAPPVTAPPAPPLDQAGIPGPAAPLPLPPSEPVSKPPPKPPEPPKTHAQKLISQARQLSGDVVEWVTLRVQLTQMVIEDRVDQRLRHVEETLNVLVERAIVVLLGAVAVFFLLFAVAFGLGAWLGHPGWGFLIVGILLVIVTLVVRAMSFAVVDLPRLSEGAPPASAPAAPPEAGTTSAPVPTLPVQAQEPPAAPTATHGSEANDKPPESKLVEDEMVNQSL